MPADIIPADERPDAEYPLVLITGRQLEHWHTGSMTRRPGVLDAIEPDPVASLHPAGSRGARRRSRAARSRSRRGAAAVTLYARADDGTPRGAVFVPFCYYEAATTCSPIRRSIRSARFPEFKYCAVRVTAGGTPAAIVGYARGGGGSR